MVHPLFLGVDVGTQSLRASLVDSSGNCCAWSIHEIETAHPQPGWAEQEVNAWWRAARSAIGKALANARVSADQIAAIGLDCTACTVLACDAAGQPLRAALLWMDQRAYREAEEISATGDPSLRYVSGVVSPEWMLPKALWLKRHEPRIYQCAERLVECTDWLMHRLTGEWTLSLNHVTVKWNYARPDGGWSTALLRRAGLEELPEKWPSRIVPLGKGEARLSTTAAADLGLRPGIPVAQGGIDAYLGMLGMGAVGAGDLAMIMGSSTCHLAMSEKGVFGSGMLGCYPDAVVEGLYTLEGGQTSTGSIINWYRQHFAGNEAAEAERSSRNVYEILDAKAAAVPAGSDGLVCLDYWQGNRCPLKDPRARGTLWGLTLSHGPGHVFRSIYEATAFGTRHIVEDLHSHGFTVQRLIAGGGGARSRLWLQIHADVLEQPIHVPRDSEACVLGSALVAAVHCGHYADFHEAAQHMVHSATVIEPQGSNRAAYDYFYKKYLATYPALRALMHDLSEGK
ncbi:MAG TPA: FGGY-family carbohydrate kinase [Gemmataceae bacterium]|jgi:FGGY-family pentulose kinase|nr:FGGY-family carbohydrate kinase [Gemmataceae bacterium]